MAITTSSVATAREINLAIQAKRRERAGQRVALGDGTTVAVGDLIATRRNDAALHTDRDEPVRNRQVWTAQEVRPNGDLAVTHPERGTAVLPHQYVQRHVELGWTVTGYGTQGDTVDVGIAILEPGATRNHAYVALTRGREEHHAWLPDPTGAVDPADQLEAMIAKTPQESQHWPRSSACTLPQQSSRPQSSRRCAGRRNCPSASEPVPMRPFDGDNSTRPERDQASPFADAIARRPAASSDAPRTLLLPGSRGPSSRATGAEQGSRPSPHSRVDVQRAGVGVERCCGA
ncbi:MAG TPA: hypothetical protein VIR30_13810 [Nocardioides sp.]